ncbi:hypothetical protein Tsubulata_050324, partial [Turnera subulata]
MVVSWWSSIRYKFAGGKSKKADFACLPDDVIIDILSRLPADHLLQCQRVCKKWRLLTSTASFAQLQVRRGAPVILGCYFDYSNPYCFYLNVAMNVATKLSLLQPIRRFLNLDEGEPNPPRHIVENCHLLSSCDGLILAIRRRRPLYVFLYNPITQEEIAIPPELLDLGRICGLYFHPVTKEYRMLCAFALNNHFFRYYIVNLPTFSYRALSPDFCCRPPSALGIYIASKATLVNGNLHWMVEHREESNRLEKHPPKVRKDDHQPCANSILRFNIDTEVLDT